jgi:simple sugar transport system ATP-binding protein
LLRARAIAKRFGAARALDGVDFDAAPGEIHALLGENGAGKTTLMRILAGALRADVGRVTLDDKALPAGSPRAALEAGIAAVHQSPMLFERLTWEENLALGGRPDTTAARKRAAQLGFELPRPQTLVQDCALPERVRLELLLALSFDPRVLILDEPTGVLAPSEIDSFLALLRALRAEGRIVILVTHRLAEALAVADRVTVLRQGRVTASLAAAQTSAEELARLMVGELPPPRESAPHPARAGAPALEIENLTLVQSGRRLLDRLALTLCPGEIVGIAGVEGNGQAELVEILAGVRRASAGAVHGSGLAVIAQDRDLDGLVLPLSLWENLVLSRPLLKRFGRGGWLHRKAAIRFADELIARFSIRTPGPELPAAALSGGNRQRLIVARTLASAPRVIVAHNPTRGLDLAASAEIAGRLAGFAAEGGAVLLISTDLDELLALSTRLFVMSAGRLRALAADERSPQRLGILMAGQWN